MKNYTTRLIQIGQRPKMNITDLCEQNHKISN